MSFSDSNPKYTHSIDILKVAWLPYLVFRVYHLPPPGCQPGLLTVAQTTGLSLRSTWVQHLVASLTGQFNCYDFLERYLTS
jgi:hypothetical protein